MLKYKKGDILILGHGSADGVEQEIVEVRRISGVLHYGFQPLERPKQSVRVHWFPCDIIDWLGDYQRKGLWVAVR